MGAVVTCQTMAMGSTPRAEVTTRYFAITKQQKD